MLVKAQLVALYEIWFGRLTFSQAIREQRLELDSTPALIRAFPKWFGLSPAAKIVRSTAEPTSATA
jgi:hypothetical protein